MMKDTQQLFEGWLSGDLTPEEIDQLLARIEEGKEDAPWPSLIGSLISDPGMAGMGSVEQRERLFRQLMERGRQVTGSGVLPESAPQKASIRLFRWAAAAAVLLLTLGGYWWYQSRSTGQVPGSGNAMPVAAADLRPGGNKAILTLGNGSKIVLDSAGKGKLAEQPGALIVKAGNGQIAYRQEDGSTPAAAGHGATVFNTLSTPRGGQYQLTLPDGSLVWLNAASSITYPTAFTGAERKVRVSGEVYFEVARNNSMPFRVQAKEMDVTVLGTHFDVRAYDDDPSINTSLLEGAVVVSQGSQRAKLQPGNQAQLKADGSLQVLPAADMDAVMAWKNGYFSFHHTDLQTVMRELSRWYDVEVEYRGTIPDMKFGGDISRSANASQVLHILEESRIHFTIEGKKIIVTP